jgi:hypothetical protein
MMRVQLPSITSSLEAHSMAPHEATHDVPPHDVAIPPSLVASVVGTIKGDSGQMIRAPSTHGSRARTKPEPESRRGRKVP